MPNAETAIKTSSGLGSIGVGELTNGFGADMLALSKSYSNVSAYLRNSSLTWLGPNANFSFPVDATPLKTIIDTSISSYPGAFVLSQGTNGDNGSLLWLNSSPVLIGNADENRFTGSSSPAFIAQGKLANGDIVLASALTSTSQISLYKKNGSLSRTLSSPSGPIAIAFGHFDSDANEDMAVLNSISNNISLYDGSQLFTATSPYKSISLPITGAKCIVAASIRGDGFDDLIIGYDGGGYILYNKEDGTYFDASMSERIGTDVPGSRTAVSVDDLNGNGIKGDIALLNHAANDIEVYLRNDSWTGTYFDNAPSALLDPLEPVSSFVLGDFGGSSATDVAALAEDSKVLLFIQTFGFIQDWVPDAQFSIGPDPLAIAAGDLNDDGSADLLISYQDLPVMAAHLRTGDSTFKNAFNFTTGAAAFSVLAADINGDLRCDIACASPDSHSISMWYQNNLVPVAGIGPVVSAYEGTYVDFSGAPSEDSYSDIDSLNYTWSFGDGGIGYGKMASHLYMDNGSYPVSLTVRDRGELTNQTTVMLTIWDKKPIVDFGWAPTDPTEGQSVLFTDLSNSSPDVIVGNDWYFSDTGEHEKGASVSHTFGQQGSYLVILNVTDDDGSVNSTTRTVIVSDTHPTASFTASTNSTLEGGSVQFTSTSAPGLGGDPANQWNWTFGDGRFSNEENPVHVYANVGNFTVILKVKDQDDVAWTISPPQNIEVKNIAPIANFTWDPPTPVETQPVNFTDTSWHYDGDRLVDWTWSFGDGEVGYGSNVSHSYSRAGDYLVALTVKDDDASTSITTKSITILDTSPKANFTFSPSWPIEGEPVYFNSTTVIFVPIAYYNWTITGAPPIFGANIIWTFAQAGSYQVTLNVTDAHGRYDSRTLMIEVHESNITVDFAWSPSSPHEGEQVNFTCSWDSYESITNWTWDFGNGTFFYGQEANWTFGLNGSYQVNLRVEDIDGNSANITKTVTVGETYPHASFTMWPTVPDEGAWVCFNDTSELSPISGLNITRWQWYFDGNPANTTANARYRFGDGHHNATLVVWDAHGIRNVSALSEFDVTDLPPIASFTFGNAVEGSPVQFASTSTYAWNPINGYNWSFGDGTFGPNHSSVSHPYNRTGWYNVTLTIWDDQTRSSAVSHMVYVSPEAPEVHLSLLGDSIEGKVTLFKLTNSTHNELISWNWSYDGNQTWTMYYDAEPGTMHTFPDSGSYVVSVNVTEADGNWTLVSIKVLVQDTGPLVSRFWLPNVQTYYMDQEVSFWCNATPTYRPITRYEWNFNYDNGPWIASDPLLANHTSHVFTQPGTFFVMVRVWDDDNATEYTAAIQIDILNVRPVARFTFHNSTEGGGWVVFDASLSYDSSTDNSSLQFSWNFDDGSGWTPYSAATKTISWDFESDDSYTVTLKVRDQWGNPWGMTSSPVSATIIIDRTPPSLVMLSTGRNATADEIIVISANVTDLSSGVKQVTLTYRIGNGSWISLTMTPTEQPHVYSGQIPAQPDNTTVYYYVQTIDNVNNSFVTQTFQIEIKAAVVDNTSSLMWIIGLLAAIIVLLVVFIIFGPVPVDEVFIIYQDGRLMAHQTRRLKPGMDDEILSSMLIAIQSFVRDSFKDESSTHLQRLDFGEKKILVEKGSSFFLAVVLHGKRAGSVPNRMQRVISDIDAHYDEALREWDGDFEKVRGIKDSTEKLMRGVNFLPQLKSKEGMSTE